MKKLTSLILAIFMCFSILPQINMCMAEAEYIAPTNLEFVKALGIVNDSTDGTDRLTRQALAGIMSTIVSGGVQPSGIYDTYPYTDVDITASADIIPAVKSGIMQGTSETTFSPNETVSNLDLLTTMVSLLGYRTNAEALGGYPNGYVSVAYSLDIDLPLSSFDAPATYDSLAYCLKASVNADVQYLSGTTSAKEPFLKHYFNIEQITGVVNANYRTDLSMLGSVSMGFVRIDDEIYELDDTTKALSDKLGFKVDAYFKETTWGDKQVIYYEERENHTKTITLDDADRFDGYRLKYDDEDRSLSIKLDEASQIVYNDELLLNYDTSIITFSNEAFMDGGITCVDNDNDGVYELIQIDAFECYVVDHVNGERIYNKYRKPDVLDLTGLEQFDDYRIVNVLGENLRFSDIDKGDVLSVSRNLSGEVKLISVSIDSFSGVVTAYSIDDENKITLEIDGTDFTTSPCLAMSDELSKLKGGNKIVAYFNKLGKICDVECDDYIKYKTGYLVYEPHPVK